MRPWSVLRSSMVDTPLLAVVAMCLCVCVCVCVCSGVLYRTCSVLGWGAPLMQHDVRPLLAPHYTQL